MESATFICGHPKSGTSLLAGLLDGHSQLIVFPEETGYYRRFVPATGALSLTEMVDLASEEILRIFKWDPVKPHHSQSGYEDRDYRDLDFSEIRQEFERFVRTFGGQAKAILPSAILAYGSIEGLSLEDSRRWVEKTPYNECFADSIFSSWAEARCLHIVRDPRDNFTSHARKHPDWGPEAFIDSWRRSARLGMRNQERYGPERYKIIRYEELVTDVSSIITEVVRFLGVEAEQSILIPSRRGRPWPGNSMYEDEFTSVSDSPVGRWKRILDADTVRRIEGPAQSEMNSFGYLPVAGSSLGSSLRWLAYRVGSIRSGLTTRMTDLI